MHSADTANNISPSVHDCVLTHKYCSSKMGKVSPSQRSLSLKAVPGSRTHNIPTTVFPANLQVKAMVAVLELVVSEPSHFK